MNLKRYLILLVTLMVLFIGINKVSAFKNDYGQNVPDDNYDASTDENNLSSYTSDKCSNNGSCFKGLGLRLKLIRYDKSVSDFEDVISTIYILNPNMLVDTVLTNGTRLPSSEGDFADSSLGLTYLDPSAYDLDTVDYNKVGTEFGNDAKIPHQDGESYTCASGSEKTGVNNAFINPKEHSYTSKPFGCPWEGCPETEYTASAVGYGSSNANCNFWKFNNLTATQAKSFSHPYHWGFLDFTFKYMSGYQKIIYLAKSPYLNMNGAENYISDTDITEENIANNYLDTKIMKKYAGSLEKVEQYFKVKLDSKDIGKYYIQVEGIYRVYLDKKDTPTTFLVKSVNSTTCEEGESSGFDRTDGDTYQTNSPTDCANAGLTWVDVGYARKAEAAVPASCSVSGCNSLDTTANKKACCKAASGTWSDGKAAVSAVPDSKRCVESCTVSSCSVANIPKYRPNNDYCGTRNHHLIYGTQWYGYSELRYTMSSTDESCATDKSSTLLADLMENNKHCEIAEDSSSYSQQELANQCANTGYKYYIGPDPERALVGMTSSNKYNLYGSDGNKCRSGVKRYYVMDIEDPDMCQTVCASAGSKDSNSYLQCAENYCDHDVDYSLGGQPFVRKRDCIINACGYTYGNSPTMGSKTATNRQSVSSCANSTLFKTGSGTNYTLDKTAYNSSSSCGTNGLGSISNGYGKDSVCIGDAVTDFNGNDADDTPFDQRTYINVACQETESITSIGGMNTPVKAGLPISYAINTKGQVTCVAFFNYEQWKVDYASIPSQDIIRRKRLDYIYNKFNNLMTNGYTVDSSLTNFEAYGLDGKKKEQWTITDADGFGQVNWDEYKIDINYSSASAESKETLKNGTTKNQSEDPLTNATASKATLSVVPSEMDLTNGVYKAYSTGYKNSAGVINSDKKIIQVANNSISTPGTGLNGNSELIGYVQTTTDTKSYVYAKYCVDREGRVYKADDTGICDDNKEGRNVFYTDLNDVVSLNLDSNIHNIKGTVTVESSLPSSSMEIYKNEDICPISIEDGQTKQATCKFKIISGDSYGDKTFINGSGVEVMIEFYDYNGIQIKPDSYKVTIKSPYRNDISTNKYNKLSLRPAALASGLEDINLKGEFQVTGYSTQPCSIDLTIVQKGNMCEVEKTSTKVYNVNTSVASPKAVMGGMLNQRITQRITQDYYSADHLPINLGRLGRPKSEGGLYKYLLDLQKAEFDSQTVVVGYVNNGYKGEFCFRPESSTVKQCVKNTTTGYGLYLPGQYEEITKYCKENWAIDTYGYESEYDCVDTCARCPTHESEVTGWEDSAEATRDNINKVNNFCDAYATYGYSSKETCVSLVYERCINPGEYKYRPINEKNPFPSAVDNENIAPGYNSGDRIIGSNWKGKEYYITEGSPDTPRYQIALTSERIRRIKNAISDDNKASVYTQLNPVSSSKDDTVYMSKYIREDLYFHDMFCYIQGNKVSNAGGCYE